MFGYFWGQVPGEDEDVVWFGFLNFFWGVDGDMDAGQVAALFVGVAIDGVGKEIAADAAVIEEGVAFSWGAVANDFFALSLGFDEEEEDALLKFADALGEGGIWGHGAESCGLFFVMELAQGVGDGVCGVVLCVAGINAQGAAMGFECFDVVDGQPVLGEYFFDRGKGEIGEVLMVDRVKLVVFEETKQVGEFSGDDACWFEKGFDAGDEVVDVGDVGEDVIGDDEVSLFVFCGEFVGKFGAEELHERGDILFEGGGGDVGGGFDAEDGDAAILEILEEVAVVTG